MTIPIETLREDLDLIDGAASFTTYKVREAKRRVSAALTELGERRERVAGHPPGVSGDEVYRAFNELDSLRTALAAMTAERDAAVQRAEEAKAKLAEELYPMAVNPLAAKYATELDAERTRADALAARVDDLAMLVRQLVHSIRKHSPDNETARKAMDYLRRHELQGSPLRTAILSPAPDAAQPNNQQEQP